MMRMSERHQQLFPTSGAIDEELLIGREGAVRELAARIEARRDTLIIERRQVGKSSTLRAAVQRSRRESNTVVAASDLKIDGVQTSSQLGERLAALEAGAQLRQRPTAVVIDEVQEIGEWGADGEGVENALAAAARRTNRQLVFAFAGSEEHALAGLFGKGRPLHVVSDRYVLPDIRHEEWTAGLRERMADGGFEITEDALETLLAASKGHPLCTMHAAKESYLAATDAEASVVEVLHVEAGLAQARGQLFWEEFTSG